MLHLQNLEIGEDNEFPAYANFSTFHRLHSKNSEAPFDMKRASNPEHHPRRHHRSRLVNPMNKNLDTKLDNFPVLSSTNHAAFNSSMEFPNDNVNQAIRKLNVQSVSYALEGVSIIHFH